MDLQLKNKIVFITGSTAGIGFATAKTMLAEGVRLIINGRSQDSIDKAIEKLKAEYPESEISGMAADFSKLEEVESLMQKLPPIDVLINNVGIFSDLPFWETSDDDWYRQFEVNVMSGVRLSRHILPGMLERNTGRIVFISSECATLVPTNLIAYSMTKTAILAVSRGLAQLTKGTNVTVNTVVPGSTLSEGAENLISEIAEREGKSPKEIETDFFSGERPYSLLQRFASVEEVANTITYLASGKASATNGAAIKVDGGSMGGIL